MCPNKIVFKLPKLGKPNFVSYKMLQNSKTLWSCIDNGSIIRSGSKKLFILDFFHILIRPQFLCVNKMDIKIQSSFSYFSF